MNTKEKTELAKKIATIMHFGQVDKQDEPYIFHVNRVAESEHLIDETDKIIAYLHDVVEDTPYGIDRIIDIFGEEVGQCVDNVTKRKGESTESYFARVNSNARSARVKFADTTDNLTRSREGLDEATIARLDTKYKKYLHLNIYKGE